MSLPIDYRVNCPQCGSDSIFTLMDSPSRRLPVRASRECRQCSYRFYTKFDKYTADVTSLAEATVFKAYDSELWSGYFITGMYDTREEAVDAQIEELTKEAN